MDSTSFPNCTPSSETKKPSLEALDQTAEALQFGIEFFFSTQRGSQFWSNELQGNPAITAEYVIFCQIFGSESHLPFHDQKESISEYFFRLQNEDGSWSNLSHSRGDLSITAEIYLALRIIGHSIDSPRLKLSEEFILKNGGLQKINLFTKYVFAFFGIVPWESLPIIPPEFILVPTQIPLHFRSLGTFTQGMLAPLMVIQHFRPIYALPNGKTAKNDWLDHLIQTSDEPIEAWDNSIYKDLPEEGTSFFRSLPLTQPLLKLYSRFPVRKLREEALQQCTRAILSHQEPSGALGTHLWQMMLSVIALRLKGYDAHSLVIKRATHALFPLLREDRNRLRVQFSKTSTMDTALTLIALLDSKCHPKDQRILLSVQWLLNRQSEVPKSNRDLKGWASEYSCGIHPHLPTTSIVIFALLRQDSTLAHTPSIQNSIEWIMEMQNSEGGWGSYSLCDSSIAYSRVYHDPLLDLFDVSSPGSTAVALQALGYYLKSPGLKMTVNKLQQVECALHLGIEYLAEFQNPNGSWAEKGNSNPFYGTSLVLQGLAQLGEKFLSLEETMVQKAILWLKSSQNEDGSWGENASSPTITAWAVLGLLTHLPANDPVLTSGIEFLLLTQSLADETARDFEGGCRLPTSQGQTWQDEGYQLDIIPRLLSIRPTGYQHIFPMMALGRYFEKSLQNNSK